MEEPEVLASSAPSPGVLAGIIIASLIIAALIGVLMLYVQRYYAATTGVAPRPDPTIEAPRNNHSTRPTAEELQQWHAPPGGLNGHPIMEENIAFDSGEDPSGHLDAPVEGIDLQRTDPVTSPGDVVIDDVDFEPTTVV